MESASSVSSVGLAFLVAMAILTLTLKRQYAFLPILLVASYMTLGERVVFATIDFTLLRMLIIVCWVRVFSRREMALYELNSMDKTFLWYVIVSVIANTMLERSVSAMTNRLGFAYNAVGIYFFFRCVLRDSSDFQRVFRALCIIVLPLVAAMIYEDLSGRNLFSIFGGVPEYSQVRVGELRAQGPFRHPVLAGTYGATMMPFFAALWFAGGKKYLPVIGLVSVTIITILSSSSGPVMAYGFGLVGLAMWKYRHHMRAVRWGLLLSLLGLHVLMNAPVWYLIGKLSFFMGGTGWHRSVLIDQAIIHFGEWWLYGTSRTAHWGENSGLILLPIDHEMVDITSQFILIGVNGGIVPLILFLWILKTGFRIVGLRVKAISDNELSEAFLVWSLGVSLFAHAVSFISVSYFDQITVFWYLLLAMIGALARNREDGCEVFA